MSVEILEQVKNFLVRLVKDEAFRSQLMSEKTEEVQKVITDGGYNFSQEEFETAAIKILDLKESGEFHELSEEELVGAVGGISSSWGGKYKWPIEKEPIIQPLYGVVYQPPGDEPKPEPVWKPLPGVEFQPLDTPGAIAHYGVIMPPELI